MIVGLAGYWEESFAEELASNRTVNVRGGEGNNIPLDRYNEFVNCAFKCELTEYKAD